MDIHFFITTISSLLLIISGLLALVGSFGLLYLPNFYIRVHAPTLANTMGSICMILASMLIFSDSFQKLIFREVIIIMLLVLSSPITATFLMQAAIYRSSKK